MSIIPIEFNDYGDAELTTVLAHLVCNMQSLANDLSQSRPDVTEALDAIVDATQSTPNPNMTFDIKQNFDSAVNTKDDPTFNFRYLVVLDRKNRKIRLHEHSIMYMGEDDWFNGSGEMHFEAKAMEGEEFKRKAQFIIETSK